MSKYIVSARKYRPTTFSEVVGQHTITETLEKSILTDRIPQAVLFAGPRGVGKTSCARIFAREINRKYLSSQEEENFEYNIFELDAASNNSVEEVRRLIDQVRYPPQKGKYKVYIIDEVHMLSLSAFNAFLKTLEEPPPYAVFVLATTEWHKIPATISSRCQVFNFKKISNLDIAHHLADLCQKMKIQYEEQALHIIAKRAEGALRDALSTLDKMILYTDGNIEKRQVITFLNTLDVEAYLNFVQNIRAANITDLLLELDVLSGKGFDLKFFVVGLNECFRDLLMCKDAKTAETLDIPDSLKGVIITQAQEWETAHLFQALDILDTIYMQLGLTQSYRISVELALLKLVAIHQDMYQKKKAIA